MHLHDIHLWLMRCAFPPSYWLYSCIFAEVESRWAKTQCSDPRLGEPPQQLHLFHCLGRSADQLYCRPPIVRAWHYARDGTRTLARVPPDFQQRGERQGRFYAIARFSFSLLPNRRQVMLNLTFGPLHGQGWICHVRGSSAHATLEPDRVLWAS